VLKAALDPAGTGERGTSVNDELARRRDHARNLPAVAHARPTKPAGAPSDCDEPHLFPTLSPQIAATLNDWERETVTALTQHSLAASTRTTYRAALRQFTKFCDHKKVSSLPASPSTVAAFLVGLLVNPATSDLSELERGRLRPISASKVLAAINRAHRIAGHPAPGEHPLVQAIIWGARRTFGNRPINAKAAIELHNLVKILSAANHDPTQQRNERIVTLWADGHTPYALSRMNDNGNPVSPRDPERADGPNLTPTGITRILRRTALGAGVDLNTRPPGAAPSREHAPALIRAAQQPSFRTIRDTALLLVMWTTAIRRSTACHLDWGDLDPPVDDPDRDIPITYRALKNDTSGNGGAGWLIRNANEPTLCPVVAYWTYRKRLTNELGFDPAQEPHQPFLVALSRSGTPLINKSTQRLQRLEPDTILRIVKRLAAQAGLPADKYGAHSLRAGWITEALNTPGVTIAQVQTVSGHSSIQVLSRYNRPNQTRVQNPNRIMQRP
jgi:site-specific recombinase XerD